MEALERTQLSLLANRHIGLQSRASNERNRDKRLQRGAIYRQLHREEINKKARERRLKNIKGRKRRRKNIKNKK